MFNAQQQRAIDWPAWPVIACAYLERSDAVDADRRAALLALLDLVGDAGTGPGLAANPTAAAEALGGRARRTPAGGPGNGSSA